MAFKISVDTGGTFTDVVISDRLGNLAIGKAPTTREHAFNGVYKAIEVAAEQLKLSVGELFSQAELLIYGTTRATNAIVTKTAAKTAFVTTMGFPDILVLREGGNQNPHDFSHGSSDPYVPRRYTFEVEERVTCEGTVSKPFNSFQARQIISKIDQESFEAVAICFLWSIVNPDHELQFAALLDALLPDVPYTLSHQLLPILREYRRASATAIDASLKPLMQSHLRELERDLRTAGFTGEILVSTASGGCSPAKDLATKPIYSIGSGPSMAPIAALEFSMLEGCGSDVIVCDTGGTTFDVGLVRDGKLTFTRDTWIGPRYKGDLASISAVDMRSIGAGGGSIAWIDEGGLMRVGPQSAGSEPGPACYGQGGVFPTVSDAAVVLGYFDPDFFLGGQIKLDAVAARRAIATISSCIQLSVEETAFRIISLAGDFMMRAISDITINEGVNPRESTIVAGGGAAGLNIMLIAKELGCDQVILPKVAAVLSAAGMQYSDIVAEESCSLFTRSDQFQFERVNKALQSLADRLDVFRRTLAGRTSDYEVEFTAECRYQSQVWELDTPIEAGRIDTRAHLDSVLEEFHAIHERVLGVRDEASSVEFINWRARLTQRLAKTAASLGSASAELVSPPRSRQCFFGTAEPQETTIFRATDIGPGAEIRGPAIVEEPTTTLVVYPGMSATVSAHGNYVLRLH